ncbi:hypothetical protein [Neobacillus cucumis]|uniref:hypothetical protein n=1 Tax=Neobacillus cucumis TaxID=1740721 RepID=UPI002E239ABD|nr:hypothetical protein [Neobacillus cucumis]
MTQKSRGAVRRQANFGQLDSEIMRSCPSQAKFGQPKPEVMQSCPKASEFRTA